MNTEQIRRLCDNKIKNLEHISSFPKLVHCYYAHESIRLTRNKVAFSYFKWNHHNLNRIKAIENAVEIRQ